MAGLTLLGMVQAACNELGYDAPLPLIGNADSDATQFLALAQAVGEDLLSNYDWSALVQEGATISLVAGQEAYALPPDFDRLIGGTQWDRTNRWMTLGPDDPQTARMRRESIFQTAPRRAIRQVGSTITVWPIPGTTGDVLAFDYVSSAFARSAAGAAQSAFAADTDTTMFRSRLMICGLKWMWMAAKGMDASALAASYETERRKAVARDKGGGRTLSMGGGFDRDRMGNADGITLGGPTVIIGTDGGDGIATD